jgi:hypothetical protein
MLITLQNDVHGTEVRVKLPKRGMFTRRATDVILDKLCGIPGCCCGGICGYQDGIPDGFILNDTRDSDCISIVADREMVEV